MEKLTLLAATQMGMEAITAQELKDLGYNDVEVQNGKVRFYGNESDIARTNLWLRTADRILIEMAAFEAVTFDQLFEGTKAIDWASWIPADAEFPVQGRSHKSQLSSVPACQSIVKKAVVEKLKEAYKTEWFQETGAYYAIEVSLLKDRAVITLDTTGPSLHKRGYRKTVPIAPLKETMAAALVLLSRWKPERPLYDPFCGSGTILIEAAMIGWNIAPGLRRNFPSEHWSRMKDEHWDVAREEAYDAFSDEIPLDIFGTDIDPTAIEIAELSARKSGLGDELKFRALSFDQAHPNGDYGCLITNPPYGERLGEESDMKRFATGLGRMHKQLDTWSTFVLSPSKTFEKDFGGKATKRRKLYNGRIECQLYQYFGPLPPRNHGAD